MSAHTTDYMLLLPFHAIQVFRTDRLLQSDLNTRDQRQDSGLGEWVNKSGNKEGGDDISGHINPVHRSCRVLAERFLERTVKRSGDVGEGVFHQAKESGSFLRSKVKI